MQAIVSTNMNKYDLRIKIPMIKKIWTMMNSNSFLRTVPASNCTTTCYVQTFSAEHPTSHIVTCLMQLNTAGGNERVSCDEESKWRHAVT